MSSKSGSEVIGAAVIKLDLDGTGMPSQIKKYGVVLEGLGKQTGSKMANALSVAFGSLLKSGITTVWNKVTDGITGSIEAGKDFGSKMSQVAATLGYSMDELGDKSSDAAKTVSDLTDFAKEMGKSTVFSARESAEALNYMALAGYDAETSMKMLPNVLNLAAAGNFSLATASDMVTDAQTALGLTIEETTVLVDQMAKTASKSNTSVEQLGEAILTVGGTAGYMAGGTEELNSVLGVLANNGIKGSEAGTHLRNMLLSLSSPTDKANALLKKLKVNVFDANGNMRSFSEIFPDLNAAMAEFTDQEKIDAFSLLFNTRDIASATALLGVTTDEWHELTGVITDSAGAAQNMADVQLDNLAGDTTLLQSAWEGFQITLSEKVEPILRKVVESLTGFVGWLSDNWDWFSNVVGGIAAFLGAIAAITTALKLYKKVHTAVTAVHKVSSKVIGVSAKGFKKLEGAIQPKEVGEKTSKLGSFFTKLKDTIKGAISGISEILTTAVKSILDPIKELLKGVAEALAGFFQALASPEVLIGAVNFAAVAASIAAAIFLIGSAIGAVMPALTDLFNNIIMPVAEFLAGTLLSIIEAITNAIVIITNGALIPLINVLGGTFIGIIKTVGDILNSILKTALEGIANVVDTVGDGFLKMGEAIKTALDGVSGVLSAFAEIIKAIAAAAVAIVSLVTGHSINYGNGYAHLFAKGGKVEGPGTSTSDSIPAMLSAGEYVINAKAAQGIGYEALDALNAGETFSLAGIAMSFEDDYSAGGSDNRGVSIGEQKFIINNELDAQDIGRVMMQSIRRAA